MSCLQPTIGAPVGSWLKGLRNGDVVGPDWMHILYSNMQSSGANRLKFRAYRRL